MESLAKLSRFASKVRRHADIRPRPVTYVGEGRLLARTIYGTRMFLDARDIVITPIIALKGYWEPELGDYIRSYLRPGMTFVDVGANMGYFSCLAAARVGPTGRVVAYEADPEVHAFLVDNLSLNWATSWTEAVNAAVWSEARTLTLHRRGKYKGNTSVAKIGDDALLRCLDTSEAFDVRAAPLDELIPHGVVPDLVKIDVEGAEPWVLRGIAAAMSGQRKPTLLVEWSPDQIRDCGGDPSEVANFARLNRLRMSVLENGPAEVSPDALDSIPHATLVIGG